MRMLSELEAELNELMIERKKLYDEYVHDWKKGKDMTHSPYSRFLSDNYRRMKNLEINVNQARQGQRRYGKN